MAEQTEDVSKCKAVTCPLGLWEKDGKGWNRMEKESLVGQQLNAWFCEGSFKASQNHSKPLCPERATKNAQKCNIDERD